MTKKEFEYVECDCSLPTHMIRFSYNKEYCYLTTHLASTSLLSRIGGGIKYIFGHKSNYGDFQETLLRPASAKKVISILENYIAHEKTMRENV